MDVGTGSIIFSSGVPDLVMALACPSSRQVLFSWTIGQSEKKTEMISVERVERVGHGCGESELLPL